MKELTKVKPYSVIISVADIDDMADWYGKKLGFKAVFPQPLTMFNTKLQFLH